jgi:methyl-accepting chemotaxis protein
MRLAGLSLKAKAGVAAAVLFAAGLAIAGGLSFLAMSAVTEDSHAERLSRAIQEGLSTLKDVRIRMGTYADMLSRHPDVVAAVKSNDPAVLQQVLVREFTNLHASDATVASLEATDAKGVIVMRGHNPGKKGDDKSKLPQIKGALSGQATGGLTVSPTSGEAAEDSVRPIRAGETIIGTLKVGSYFKVATAEELKRKTGLDIAFLANGKVTETTFAAGADVSVPGETLQAALAGNARPLAVAIKGNPYTAQFVHLPSDNGDGMTIGFFAQRSGIVEAQSEFRNSLLMKGLLAFLLIVPGVLALANLATRQMLRLAAAMQHIADGDLDASVPYAKNSDEIGTMARAVEVFKSNAIERRRFEAEQKEAERHSAAERKAHMNDLADSFAAAVGTMVDTVSAAAAELEVAASSLTQTAETPVT